MKQNAKRKSLIIVVAMLVLLATVLGMSGMTFAKYISTDSVPTQNATVAQWGWVVTTNATDLFGENYGDTVTENLVTVNTTGNATAVKAYADTDSSIVAPGTTGALYFTITGSAEVLTTISIDVADGVEEVTLSDGTNTYAPIKWTLYKEVDPTNNNNNPWTEVTNAVDLSLADMTDFLENMGTTTAIAAGGTYANAGSYRLTWEWAFNNTNATAVEKLATTEADGEDADYLTGNEADTILGQYAAGIALPDGYTANLEVAFGMTIIVEQAQPAGN